MKSNDNKVTMMMKNNKNYKSFFRDGSLSGRGVHHATPQQKMQ